MSTDFDVIVVGAGSVGLACGYALARQGHSVAVLERERRVGAGISSRNSEVIHAGLHYPPGSLKARFCVEGRRLLYDFLDRHNVAFNKCGKLIVATQDSELAALDALAARGEANGVEGVTRLDAAQALALEPALRTVGALHSAESGVFDAHGYHGRAGRRDRGPWRRGGAELAVPGGDTPSADQVEVRIGGDDPSTVTTRRLILSGGLQAQEIGGNGGRVSRREDPGAALRQRQLLCADGPRAVPAPDLSRHPSPARWAFITAATWAGRRASGPTWSSSMRRTMPSIRPGCGISRTTCAASGPACRTAP
jgi:glycine/D-amino acid oxidase-like deaminating enzyme